MTGADKLLVGAALALVAAATAQATSIVGERAGLVALFSRPEPSEVVVTAEGESEETSAIDSTFTTQLEASLPDELRQRVVQESLVLVEARFGDRGAIIDVMTRGTDARALSLRGVTLATGRFPSVGERAVVAGARRTDVLAEGRFRVGSQWWPVVGTVSAPGTIYESELWCDRTALLAEVDVDIGSLYFRARRAEDIRTLESRIQATQDGTHLVVQPYGRYLRRRLEIDLREHPGWGIALAVLGLCVAAALSIANAVHAISRHDRLTAARALRMSWAIAFVAGGVGALVSSTLVRHTDERLAVLFDTPATGPMRLAALGIVVLVGVVAHLTLARVLGAHASKKSSGLPT